MSEWRNRVPIVEWRTVKDSSGMEIRYHIEAKVWSDEWERFATVDIDCAGEGRGDDLADEIVRMHNAGLVKP